MQWSAYTPKKSERTVTCVYELIIFKTTFYTIEQYLLQIFISLYDKLIMNYPQFYVMWCVVLGRHATGMQLDIVRILSQCDHIYGMNEWVKRVFSEIKLKGTLFRRRCTYGCGYLTTRG